MSLILYVFGSISTQRRGKIHLGSDFDTPRRHSRCRRQRIAEIVATYNGTYGDNHAIYTALRHARVNSNELCAYCFDNPEFIQGYQRFLNQPKEN